jgi:hypothetical protein
LQYYEDCVVDPNGHTGSFQGEYQQFLRCQLGTDTSSIRNIQGRISQAPATSILIEDSYLNLSMQAIPKTTIRRCYGKMSARTREYEGTFTVENNVFSAPAQGFSAIVFSNYNPGAAIKWSFKNNIIETATAAEFMMVDATNAGYIVASASEFFNNVLSGSAAYDADLVTADSGNTVIVDNVTGDALIGAANTYNPNDYGYASGSPAIGAGTDGSNIGFAVGEVSQRQTS